MVKSKVGHVRLVFELWGKEVKKGPKMAMYFFQKSTKNIYKNSTDLKLVSNDR